MTLLLAGIFLALTVGTAAKIIGGLLIAAAIALVVLWWPDLRQTFSPAAGLDDLEVTLQKYEEDFVGFMSSSSTAVSGLQIPDLTTLTGHLAWVEIVNHNQTASTEILSMRLGLFDPASGQEITPRDVLELTLDPPNRRMPARGRCVFRFGFKASYKGYIERTNPAKRIFLMIKAVGSKSELKIALGEDFFV